MGIGVLISVGSLRLRKCGECGSRMHCKERAAEPCAVGGGGAYRAGLSRYNSNCAWEIL